MLPSFIFGIVISVCLSYSAPARNVTPDALSVMNCGVRNVDIHSTERHSMCDSRRNAGHLDAQGGKVPLPFLA